MKSLILIALCILAAEAWWTEFELSAVENSNEGILKTELKVNRFNRSTYTIGGGFEITGNIGHNYECEARAFVSRQGNNQYIRLPYKIQRDNCCEFFDTVYFRVVEKELIAYTNLPERQVGVPLCDTYTKGAYTLEPDPVDKNIFLKHIDTGIYKLELLIYDKTSGSISSQLAVFVKFY